MNEKQLENYTKIIEEIERISPRKFNKNTRKVYKRFVFKFSKTLIENNINISSIRNITTENLKQYAKIEMAKGRKIPIIISELRGVEYYFNYINRDKPTTRRNILLDLRILQKYLEGGDKK